MATPEYRNMRIERVALADADTGGGVFAWQNPHENTVLVHNVVVHTTTKSTAASTVDIGATATSAVTSSDTLIDGVDLGTAAGVFDAIKNKGSNGVAPVSVASGKWVTASKASGACAGLVGWAYIHYVVAA